MPEKLLMAFAIAGMLVQSCDGQSAGFKRYADPVYGVSFEYPGDWSSGEQGAFYFYLGTAILFPPGPGGQPDEPRVRVGFKAPDGAGAPYANTDLSGVEFVYAVLLHVTADACYARLAPEHWQRPPIVIHGVTYRRAQGGDAGLGHGARRDDYATFRHGRCYLFEGGVHSATSDEARPYSEAPLVKELDAVMQSVRIR